MKTGNYFMDLMTPEEQALMVRLSVITDLEPLCLERWADRPAVNLPDRIITYRALWEETALFRTVLAENGVRRGDRVAVVLPNSLECIEAFLAVTTYGAVAVMVPPAGPAAAKEESCRVAGCEVAFCAEALQGVRLLPCSADGITAGTPAAKLNPEDAVAAFFTGGTSGTLKCALLSNRALMTGVYNGIFSPGPSFFQKYYGLIPFSHIFGTVRNLLSCLQSGSQIRPCSDMNKIVADLKEYKPTILVLIPALAAMLLNLSKLYGPEVFGGELKQIVTGGAPQPTEIARIYIEKLGINLVSGYGLTETANLVSGNVEVLTKQDSVGRLYDFQQIRFVDQEIQLKGDNIFMEYINNPEETAAAFSDGWFRTGDIGYLDEDGYLFITGRIKNLIYFTNGEKICPEQIEAKVDRIPGVKASMVSMKANSFGVKLLTCEIFADPAEDQERIRLAVEKISRDLPDFSRIHQVLFRGEDFPRTSAMKIRRPSNEA